VIFKALHRKPEIEQRELSSFCSSNSTRHVPMKIRL